MNQINDGNLIRQWEETFENLIFLKEYKESSNIRPLPPRSPLVHLQNRQELFADEVPIFQNLLMEESRKFLILCQYMIPKLQTLSRLFTTWSDYRSGLIPFPSTFKVTLAGYLRSLGPFTPRSIFLSSHELNENIRLWEAAFQRFIQLTQISGSSDNGDDSSAD